jgi:hypothetical protein
LKFGDMMLRLFPDDMIPDKPSNPDAVRYFHPLTCGWFSLLKVVEETKTPPTFSNKFAIDYMSAAEPLPPELVPASITIDDFSPGKSWPSGLPKIMPDFYALTGDGFIVSNRAREFLEEAVPGAIQYIEIAVNLPSSILREKAYYYINVLPQAQTVDWSRANDSLYCEDDRKVPFKAMQDSDPLIWHEMSLDHGHRFSQSIVLIRGALWNKLIETFPLQLRDVVLSDTL